MDYHWHYTRLIETRKDRILVEGEYYENHHILPKSMGGDDSEENLIMLTAREHFIAHWLLWRIHRNRQTAFSFFCMQNFKNKKTQGAKRYTSSRAYQEAREAYIIFLKIEMTGKKFPYKKRKPHSEETKLKMSKKKIGVPLGPISNSRSKKLSLYLKYKWQEYRDAVGFIDHIEKTCKLCEKTFVTNTWGLPTEYCSKSCASKSSNKEKRPVTVIDTRTGIETFHNTITEAARYFKINRSVIYKNKHEYLIFKF